MISVRHLQKSFNGVAVLKDVNAEVEKGEVISIIGPSGTGKSTFLRCLNRLETPDGGSIVVGGVDVTDPEILLFDEPTSALDPTMVGEVLAVIKDLAKTGMTMLIVTHEMGFARDVSTRVFYMDEGVVYEDGSPAELFNRPQKPKTIEFVGQVCLKHVRDMVRLLREGLLSDGRIDEVEAQMLLRLAEPFERFGDGMVSRIAGILRQMLSDGVITDEESRRISLVLERL